jgi:hypothetical protein
MIHQRAEAVIAQLKLSYMRSMFDGTAIMAAVRLIDDMKTELEREAVSAARARDDASRQRYPDTTGQ